VEKVEESIDCWSEIEWNGMNGADGMLDWRN